MGSGGANSGLWSWADRALWAARMDGRDIGMDIGAAPNCGLMREPTIVRGLLGSSVREGWNGGAVGENRLGVVAGCMAVDVGDSEDTEGDAA